MRVFPLASFPIQVGVIRTSALVAILAGSISLLGTQALAQGVPDVMNALGVPYSPAVEHALQESDRRQIYKDIPEQPKVPFWQYLTSPELQKISPEKEEGPTPYRPSANLGAPIGEIDESHMQSDSCPTGSSQGESLNPDDRSKCEPNATAPAQPQEIAPAAVKATRPAPASRYKTTAAKPAPKPVEPIAQEQAKTEDVKKPVANQPQELLFFPDAIRDPNATPSAISSGSSSLPATQTPEAPLFPQESVSEKMAKSLQTKPASSTAVRIGGYIPAEKIQAVAFINTKGQLVLPAKAYSHICNFSQGIACVMVDPKQELASASTEMAAVEKPAYGYLTEQGKWLVPPTYSLAGDFKPVDKTPNAPILARAQWSGRDNHPKWGYINNKGINIIANEYDWAGDFSEGLAIVAMPVETEGQPIGQQYGYINPKGEMAIKPQYEEAEPFHDGLAKVWDGNLNPHGWPQYFFIKPTGERAIESPFDWISSFQNGYARVGNLGDARDKKTASTTPDKYGYMNTKGQVLIPLQFDAAWPFVSILPNQMLALVRQGAQYGYIRPSGEFAFTERFDWADEFHEGMAAVKIGNQFGFINPLGKTAVKPQYDWVGAFSSGLAPVGKKTEDGMRYGFINKTGKVTIPMRYAWVMPFSGNLAQVR